MKPLQTDSAPDVSSIDTRYICIAEGCEKDVLSADMLCIDCYRKVAADTAARLRDA